IAEGEDLVEARNDRQLLGLDRLDACPFEHVEEPRPNVRPGVFHPRLRIELLRTELRGDLGGLVTESVIEHVSERVCWIRAEDDGSPTRIGACDRGGCGCRGLPDSAFTGEEQNPGALRCRHDRCASARAFNLSSAAVMMRP